MKNLFVILLIFLSTNFLNAQSSYIIINGGITQAKGSFADNDFFNPEAGFATGGYNLGFEVGYFFNPWVGIGGAFKFSNSGFDSDIINDHLQTEYWSLFDTIYLKSGEYNLHNFLAGPYGKLDINDHFSLLGKFFIGVMSAFRPEQTLNWTEPGQEPKLLFVESKLASSFAWNVGGGLLIKFNDRLGVVFMADYISGKPKFEEFNYDDLIVETNKQDIHYFNFNIGLVLAMER